MTHPTRFDSRWNRMRFKMYEVGVNSKLISQSLLEYRSPESNSGRLMVIGIEEESSISGISAVACKELDGSKVESKIGDADDFNCGGVAGTFWLLWAIEAVPNAQQFIRMIKRPAKTAAPILVLFIFDGSWVVL